VDPLELARQLTLIEFDHFVKVQSHECLEQIWAGKITKEREAARIKAVGKKSGKGAAGGSLSTGGGGVSKDSGDGRIETGISRMINHTNQLTLWVATTIVSCENIKVRLNTLKYFVQCALKCREINNFNGITGIVAGLSMAPIARLHKTWQAFAEKWPTLSEDYEKLADIVSAKGQYASYRRELKDLKLPAIPFLGVYLTDITFIELGNPDFLPESRLINFDKRRKVSSVIKEIQRYQTVPYNFTSVEGIKQFLSRLGEPISATTTSETNDDNSMKALCVMNDDDLYAQSLIVEPRAEEDDDEDED
ncbi:cell division cycle- protein, partial [Blyttiomyces sp. JEL0837]